MKIEFVVDLRALRIIREVYEDVQNKAEISGQETVASDQWPVISGQ